MAKTKEQVIEQIRKCLPLKNGTNYEAEAERALASAMRLAAGIGMTIEQVQFKEENSGGIEQVTVGKERKNIPNWEQCLSGLSPRAYSCFAGFAGFARADYRRRSGNQGGTEWDGGICAR